MAMDALDAAITSLDIDGPATNESLAQMLRGLTQMLRGLTQMLTKSFGNIIAKKDAEIRELKVRVTALVELFCHRRRVDTQSGDSSSPSC